MSKQTIEKHNLVFSEAVLYYNQLGMQFNKQTKKEHHVSQNSIIKNSI